MRAFEIGCLLATFGGILWGVLRFFIPPTRTEWKTTGISVLALAGFANQFTNVWLAGPDPVRSGLATMTYLSSIGLFWATVHACATRPFTAIFERDVPIRIVTTGPYRFVRHPFYASYSLFWAAGHIGTGTWSTGTVTVVMVVIYLVAARNEEAKFAASPLGAAYERYREDTGLVVPRIGFGRARPAEDTVVAPSYQSVSE